MFKPGSVDAPSLTRDPAEWKANRLSQIIPAHILAYSCIVKSPNQCISLDDLLTEMLSFPDVPDARNVYLLPEEIDGFDFDEEDSLFRVSISHYIRFDMGDLMKVLSADHFVIANGQVMLKKRVNRDLSKTLIALRHLYPDDDEKEFRRKADAGFISYFHKQRLKPEEIYYPSLLNPRAFLYFDEKPSPEQALVCLFLSRRTNTIPLSVYVDLQYSEQVLIGSQRVHIGSIIGDVVSVIMKSHFFVIDDDSLTMYPPIFYDVLFTCDTNAYRYKPGESTSIIRSPMNKIRKSAIAVEVVKKPKVERRSYERYFDAFRRSLKPSSTFTPQDIFEYVLATFCPSQFFQPMQTNDLERLKQEITVWIGKNAEAVTDESIKAQGQELGNMRRETMKQLKIDTVDEERSTFLSQVMGEILSNHKELIRCDDIDYANMQTQSSAAFEQTVFCLKQ